MWIQTTHLPDNEDIVDPAGDVIDKLRRVVFITIFAIVCLFTVASLFLAVLAVLVAFNSDVFPMPELLHAFRAIGQISFPFPTSKPIVHMCRPLDRIAYLHHIATLMPRPPPTNNIRQLMNSPPFEPNCTHLSPLAISTSESTLHSNRSFDSGRQERSQRLLPDTRTQWNIGHETMILAERREQRAVCYTVWVRKGESPKLRYMLLLMLIICWCGLGLSWAVG